MQCPQVESHLPLLRELGDVLGVDAELLQDGVLQVFSLQVVLADVSQLLHVAVHGDKLILREPLTKHQDC